MQYDRRDIESALVSKGFVKENKHHKYFYHEYKGKRTGVYTYTSHGASYKSYNKTLLSFIKKQLKLDTNQQLSRLIECPMTQEEYNDFLIENGYIDPED